MGEPRRGIFFLVAGPSGAGKSTVLERLVKSEENLIKDISVTTRKPREDEIPGIAYHFWNVKEFKEAEARGDFLETAVVHGKDRYGTLKRLVNEKLESGLDVIKDIDVQGVALIRAAWSFPKTVAIFVVPPTPEELRARLSGRGTEDATTIARRLETVKSEVKCTAEYDYLVINDSIEKAVADLSAIRKAEHMRRERIEDDVLEKWSDL